MRTASVLHWRASVSDEVAPCPAYEIIESHALPLVDTARSVRSAWLHRGVERAYARFTSRWKVVILGGYAIGYVAFWVALVAPARVGRWVAVAASLPTTFTSTVFLLLLRYEIACLIVGIYEFWFFSVGNLVSAVLLALYLNDLRACLAVPVWFALQNNIMVDANTVFRRVYVTASMAILVFLLFLLAAVSLSLFDGTRSFDLLRIDADRRLVVEDALIHGYSTQVIALVRNMYRRWRTRTRPRSTPLKSSTITCVTLRARVKLRAVGEGVAALVDVAPRVETIVPQANGSTLVRLKAISVDAQFRADEITGPVISGMLLSASATRRRVVRTALVVVAYTGLSLTIVALLTPNATHINTVRVVSIACSGFFIACMFMATQRQLLRRLVFTFDFAFLSLQLLVVHACLCDMLQWGYASLPVVTIWLWIQWVLTSDAVTPIIKAKWGIRRRLPAIIMLVFIVGQILVFVAIIVEDTIELRNRVIVSITVHGHLLQMRVVPMLLSRLVLLFGWSWKILWRMWTTRPDELLMIQGSLTYVNLHHSHKQQSASGRAVMLSK